MKELEALSYKSQVAPNLIVVYSAEKAGKTTALTTLVEERIDEDTVLEAGKRIHITDIDHGLEPFINRWVEKGKPMDGTKIPSISVDIVSNKDDFHEAVCPLPGGFDYYVIDTYTRAGKFFIKSSQPNMSPGERAAKVNIKIAALFEDYIDHFEQVAWELAKRDAWLIINCHEETKNIDDVEYVRPLLYGSAGAKLNRVATGIWRLQVVPVQGPNGTVPGRQFRTATLVTGDLHIMAGDRTGALNEVEPANFAKCIAKIRAFRAAMPAASGETK